MHPKSLLGSALRGENPAWPWGDDAAAVAAFEAQCDVDGVSALLHAQMSASDWPPLVKDSLRGKAVLRAMWELRHQQVLARTLDALDAGGVHPVLVKGTALAYSLYPDPALRSRGDTDLLIPPGNNDSVHRILLSLGYERGLGVSGELVSYQANYSLHAPDGSSHTLDVHWKINNSELLSRLFTYDELRRDAIPLPKLCPHALGTSTAHAMLLACMHRCTHKQNPYYVDGDAHHDADRLIWLYDIHLLAGRLGPREWDEVVRLAQAKGLSAVCLEGMEHAQEHFNTRYPAPVRAAMLHTATTEPAALYLGGSKLRQQWMDFCALDSMSQRFRLVRELMFPSETYMRARYPERRGDGLAWLYLQRAIGGFAKRMVRGGAKP